MFLRRGQLHPKVNIKRSMKTPLHCCNTFCFTRKKVCFLLNSSSHFVIHHDNGHIPPSSSMEFICSLLKSPRCNASSHNIQRIPVTNLLFMLKGQSFCVQPCSIMFAFHILLTPLLSICVCFLIYLSRRTEETQVKTLAIISGLQTKI
jgi:hypothetical protein